MKKENKGGFIWEFGFIISSKRFIFECKIVFIHFCKKKNLFSFSLRELRSPSNIYYIWGLPDVMVKSQLVYDILRRKTQTIFPSTNKNKFYFFKFWNECSRFWHVKQVFYWLLEFQTFTLIKSWNFQHVTCYKMNEIVEYRSTIQTFKQDF